MRPAMTIRHLMTALAACVLALGLAGCTTCSRNDSETESAPQAQRSKAKRDRKKPCVNVGMTGLTPEERFANHKAGIKDASVVKRYGVRLLPEAYAHLNPMPYEPAAQMEIDLAEDLRRAGYTVTGGH